MLSAMVSDSHPNKLGWGAPSVDVASLRVGVPRAMFYEQLDAEVEAAVERALAVIKKMTAGLREAELSVTNTMPLLLSEAYKYHAEWVEKSPELYQAETLRRIRTGAQVTREDHERVARELEEMRARSGEILGEVDVLVTPTVPVLPPRVDELLAHPEELRKREMPLLRNTRPFNALGLPTISVPCGVSKSGLPIGLQISGAAGAEATVLGVAAACEKAI